MTRHIYSAFYALLLPLVLLRMLWRSRSEPGYRKRWGERFGLFPAPGLSQPIWIHAVSVGELMSIGPLLELLIGRPDCPVVLTTTTPSASRLAQHRYGGEIFHVYLPLDLPCCVNNFLARVRPARLLLVEKELWPNLLHLSSVSGCPAAVINGRMSRRSRDRYLLMPALLRPVLQSLQWVAAQSEADAEHFRTLGVPRERVQACGNLKYDVQVDEGLRQRARVQYDSWHLDGRPVILAGSIHPEEEALVLEALCPVLDAHRDALLILVPRYPDRARELMQLKQLAGFEPRLWTSVGLPEETCRCVVVDTLGDMLLLLGLARLAVMGGSFAGQGGHNLAEPAAWALPVVSGPSLENFIHSRDLLLRAEALRVVNSGPELSRVLLELLPDQSGCARMGQQGHAALARETGASLKTLELLGLAGVG